MVMRSLRRGMSQGFVKFTLFGILMLAAVGLAMSDMGGFFRGGVTNNDVLSIGDRDVKLVSFDRKLRRALARIGLSPEQAYQMGYVDQVINSEIRSTLILQDAISNDIRIGRKLIAEQISKMIEPMVQEGQNKEDVLQSFLSAQGMSEAELVQALSTEVASSLQTTALVAGNLGESKKLAKDIYVYENEARDVSYINFKLAEFDIEDEPSAEALKALYEKKKESFAIPEQRAFEVGIIKYDDLENLVDVTEEDIRAAYDEDLDSYFLPEKRTIQQAILSNLADAQKVRDLLALDKSLEDAVIEATGSNVAYTGEEDFAQDDLMDEVAEDVFASEISGIVGPTESSLGYHVLVLTNIKAAGVQPFDDVKEDIRTYLMDARLADQKFDRINRLDDMLARGLSLEDAKEEIPLDIASFEPISKSEHMTSVDSPLDQYGEDGQIIVELVFEYGQGEITPVQDMTTSPEQYVVNVTKIVPQSYESFEDKKGALQEQWVHDQKMQGTYDKVQNLLARIKVNDDEGAFKEIAKEETRKIRSLKALKRGDKPVSPLTESSIFNIFQMANGQTAFIKTEDGYGLARLDDITLLDEDKIDDAMLREVLERNAESAADEILSVYLQHLQQKTPVHVNGALIKRVYGASATQ